MNCPICKKPSAAEYCPFCSKRCADVDLAHWLRGSYALPGEAVELPETDETDDPLQGRKPH